MKNFCVFLLIIISQFSFAQTDKIFFYVEKDSLVGVKNSNGKTILKPKPSWDTGSYYNNREIKSDIFNLNFKDTAFCYYDQNGKFLFHTFMTSEGPDAFQEGFIRYSENKKGGLVNDKGQKITLAKYDWISSINFGFAKFCNGCYFDTSEDEEHAPLVGGTWGYISKSGKEIQPTSRRNHPKDFETKEHQFIPYQFEYNKKESKILDFFEKRKDQIAKINGFDCDAKILYFEIFKKPTKSQPFYEIKTFEVCDFYISGDEYNDFKNFQVSEDGNNYYVTYNDLVEYKDYSEYVLRKIPVDEWIMSNLKNDKNK